MSIDMSVVPDWERLEKHIYDCETFEDLVASIYVATHRGVKSLEGMHACMNRACEWLVRRHGIIVTIPETERIE